MNTKEKLVEILDRFVYDEWYGNGDIAEKLISNGVTVQEWISVNDRLPENIANRVLVVCERSNGVFYAHYEKPFWINLETDKPFISTVTHWMPLPKPRKENDYAKECSLQKMQQSCK